MNQGRVIDHQVLKYDYNRYTKRWTEEKKWLNEGSTDLIKRKETYIEEGEEVHVDYGERYAQLIWKQYESKKIKKKNQDQPQKEVVLGEENEANYVMKFNFIN